MRIVIAIGILVSACSASTNQPPYVPPADDYDSYDSDPRNGDPRDDPADDPRDDGQAVDDDAGLPPEGAGPAHHSEIEPNDDALHPTYIGTPNCSADGALEGEDDNDWYSVTIEHSGPYVFRTSTGEPDDDEATDTRLEVYGRDDLSSPIASDDDAGEGPASRLTVDLAVGTFYIRVIGYTTATEGDYTIHVVHPEDDGAVDADGDGVVDDPDALEIPPAQEVETESNGTIEAADSLGSAPWTIAAALDARDVDYFVFLVDRGQSITAETGPVSRDDAPVDTLIEIVDADGRSLGTDDDGADVELFSLLTVDLPRAGLYYVRVSGYGDSTHGTYSLSIE